MRVEPHEDRLETTRYLAHLAEHKKDALCGIAQAEPA
jgi:hypothetical protein